MEPDIFSTIEESLKKAYYGWEGQDQFNGTGDRLKRMYAEVFWSRDRIERTIEDALDAYFVADYDELMTVGPITVWTFCPHHIIPCRFKVFVGYIPSKSVLGLSKFVRIAKAVGKKPIMQEMYTRELAQWICKLNPKGVGVVVIGKHGCMTCRGVEQECPTTTSYLTGAIRDNPSTRAEFLSFVSMSKGDC